MTRTLVPLAVLALATAGVARAQDLDVMKFRRAGQDVLALTAAVTPPPSESGQQQAGEEVFSFESTQHYAWRNGTNRRFEYQELHTIVRAGDQVVIEYKLIYDEPGTNVFPILMPSEMPVSSPSWSDYEQRKLRKNDTEISLEVRTDTVNPRIGFLHGGSAFYQSGSQRNRADIVISRVIVKRMNRP